MLLLLLLGMVLLPSCLLLAARLDRIRCLSESAVVTLLGRVVWTESVERFGFWVLHVTVLPCAESPCTCIVEADSSRWLPLEPPKVS